MCLSWLLEPSLSIKRKTIFCYLFWSVWFVKWFAGTATPKRCVLLYISSGLLSLSALIFVSFLWGICFIVLDWLVLLFSDCFLEIKFYGKRACVFVSMLWLITKHYVYRIIFTPLLLLLFKCMLLGNTINLIQRIFICSQESLNLIPGTFISSVTIRTLSTFKLLLFFKIPALTQNVI